MQEKHHHQRKDISTSANKRPGSAGGNSREKNYNKRFQRLESHVVTLARSVANLSSEMRSQQVLLQEVEALRSEVHQLRLAQQSQQNNVSLVPPNRTMVPGANDGRRNQFNQGGTTLGQQYESGTLNLNRRNLNMIGFNSLHANRVRKLTKFFGEEPPLVRLFLKQLGYEKYASIFEESKIGMLELPYLTEDRLEKLGIPTGPRMKIFQEA